MNALEIAYLVNSVMFIYLFSIWSYKNWLNLTIKFILLVIGTTNLLFALGKLPF